ncbi:hypothetical protein POTOM_038273 [Populus tomentosa]|uniref:Uncharacterized protein n=1 Tax=Populus tomentosa TaxID=118781 RepID=A0A8X8CL71_POPTO|nr:hypothetical protein POTOM_038273 [Populus tomentosa]
MNIVRISDWMPENEPSSITGRRVQPPSPQPSGNVSPQQQLPSSTGCKFHAVLELAGLGTSVTEHTPRSAPGHMSKGVLSMDKKFIQIRQRQENKGVEDLGDVLREGGGALAKGLFRGVTGILTSPPEEAKKLRFCSGSWKRNNRCSCPASQLGFLVLLPAMICFDLTITTEARDR